MLVPFGTRVIDSNGKGVGTVSRRVLHDQRDFFLVGGNAWTETVLPAETTSPGVSGTPGYVRDRDTADEPAEPDIAVGTHVYDKAGQRIGDVEGVEIDEESGRITHLVVRHGHLLGKETDIPASLVGSVTDRIALTVASDVVKKLERGA